MPEPSANANQVRPQPSNSAQSADSVYPVGQAPNLTPLLNHHPLIALGSEGQISWINAPAARLLNGEPEHLIGLYFTELLSDPREVRDFKQSWTALSYNNAVEGNFLLTTLSGTGLQLEVLFYASFDQQNNMVEVVLLIKAAHPPEWLESIQQQNRRLRQAEMLGGFGLWEYDMERRQTYWDAGMHKLFGVPHSTTHNRRGIYVNAISRAESKRHLQVIELSAETGQPLDLKFSLQRPDGQTRTVRVCAEVQVNEAGRPKRITGVMLDTTQQDELQKTLLEEQKMLETALDTAQVGSMRWDFQSPSVQVSHQFARMLGFSPLQQEVLVEELLNQLKTGDAQRLEHAVEELKLGTKREAQLEIALKPPTPAEQSDWFALYLKVLDVDLQGRPQNVFGALQRITQLVEERNRLQRLNKQLEFVQQAAKLGYWTYDLNTRDVYWSDVLKTIYNLPPNAQSPQVEEVFSRYLAEEDIPRVEQAMADTFEQGTVSIQAKLLTADHQTKYSRITYSLVYDEWGQPASLLGCTQDITEMVETSKRLEEAYSQMQAMVENLQQSVWTVDRDMRYVVFNTTHQKRMKKLFGMDIQPGDNPFESPAMNLQAKSLAVEQVKKALAGEPNQIRFSQPEAGREQVYECNATPIRNPNNEVIGVAATIYNITPLVTENSYLVNQQSLLNTIFESNPALILFAVDQNGCLSFFNQAFRNLARRIAPQASLKLGQELPQAEEQNPYWASLQQNLQAALAGETRFFVEAFEFQGESPAYYQLRFAPLPPPQQEGRSPQLGGAVLIAHDITDLELARQSMRRAKEDAEQASRLKSQFLSTISHEMRTPLNAIVGLSDILLLEEQEPERLQNLRLLKSSSNQLLSLIGQVLDLSSLEAGKLLLQPLPIRLQELLEELVDMQQPQAHLKNLVVQLETDLMLPEVVRVDRQRLFEVLNNLLSNALKYTEHGTITLRADAYNDTHSLADLLPQLQQEYLADYTALLESSIGPYTLLLFQVQDTGIGIAPENRDSIFEEFDRGDSRVARQYGGSGLGLSIARRLVELMGGRIWADSQPGQGSCFSVLLPLQIVEPG